MKNLTQQSNVSLSDIVSEIDDFLAKQRNDIVLFYASNGTGKTRLSREFYRRFQDTLYFNALTEDLFTWDNEMRILRINRMHGFISRLEADGPETLIGRKWIKYSELEFSIKDVDGQFSGNFWEVEFFPAGKNEDSISIKISRAEERLFVWSVFEVILEKAIESDEGYENIKYIYVDDPISSMDENNAVKFAILLVEMIKRGIEKGKKFILSTHHSLFFNVIYNSFRNYRESAFILSKEGENYTVKLTSDKIFMSHIYLLKEIEVAIRNDSLSQYHFGNLRIVFEKTAAFLGHSNFSSCIKSEEDKALFAQVLNLWSHGNHSIFEIAQLLPEQKELFQRIFNDFKQTYNFKLDI